MDLSLDLGLGLSPSDMLESTDMLESSDMQLLDTSDMQITETSPTGSKGNEAPKEKKKGRGSHKFNAKVVECYDLDGNLIRTFPSCSDASKAMKATPVEISQCCKGQKDNIRGFRYRFKDENVQRRTSLVPKRGYVIETVSTDSLQQAAEPELLIGSRSSRASRGIIEQVKLIDSISARKRSQILNPPDALPRKWSRVTVKIGHIFVPSWVPNSNSLNPVLNPNKSTEGKSKSKRKR